MFGDICFMSLFVALVMPLSYEDKHYHSTIDASIDQRRAPLRA